MNHHVRPLTASLLVLLILMAGCTAGLDEGSDDSIDCNLVQPGEYVYTAGPLTSYVHVQRVGVPAIGPCPQHGDGHPSRTVPPRR